MSAAKRSVRAGVFTGDGKWDVRDLPEPTPPEGGAVLHVEAVGLCGSDLAQVHGGIGVPGEVFPVVPGLSLEHAPADTVTVPTSPNGPVSIALRTRSAAS